MFADQNSSPALAATWSLCLLACSSPDAVYQAPEPGADPAARSGAAAVVLRDQAWLMGGVSNRGRAWTPRPARFDPVLNEWALGTPDRHRAFAAAAVLDDRILVAGGADEQQEFMASARWYEPASDRWSAAPDLGLARSRAGAFVAQGRVFVLGGWTAAGNTTSVEVLDPGSGVWSEASPMPTARHGFALVEHHGLAVVLGGYVLNGASQQPCTVVEAYDPKRDRWTIGVPLPVPRAFHGAISSRGQILVFGGRVPLTAPTPPTLRGRGPQSGWEAIEATLPLARHRYAVCVLGSGAYLFGGEGPGEDLRNVQRLDLLVLRWDDHLEAPD